MNDHSLTIPADQNFSSYSIDCHTKEAQEHLTNMWRNAEQYIYHAQRLGGTIKSVKEKLKHGQFRQWHENLLGLGSSQVCLYRRLHEAGENLEKARTWAHEIDHKNANTRDLRLLLLLVDEWGAANGIVELTKIRRKSKSKPLTKSDDVSSQSLRQRKDFPPRIADVADASVAAILQHRADTGEDVLEAVLAYIEEAARSGSVQTCALAQISGPTASAGS